MIRFTSISRVSILLVGLIVFAVCSPALAQQEATSDEPGVIQQGGDSEGGNDTNNQNSESDAQQADRQQADSEPAQADSSGDGDNQGDDGERVIKPEDVDISETYNLPPNFDPQYKGSETPQSQKLTLDFHEAKLMEVVKLFSAMMNRNFIISDNIRSGKTVTIISPKPVRLDEAYQAFLASLEMNGLTIVRQGAFYKIIRSNEAVSEPMKTYDEDDSIPNAPRMVTAIIPVTNTNVEDMQSTVQNFLTKDATLVTYGSSLIITENAANLRRIKRLVKKLDRGATASETYVYEAQYAEATKLQEKLSEIFQQEEDRGGDRRRNRRQKGQQQESGDIRVQIDKIVADERTNKLVIKTNRRSFAKIKDMLKLLDVPTAVGGRVHIKYLEYANAEDVASTLSNLSSGQDDDGRGGRARRRAQREGGGGGGGTGSGVAALLQGDIQVSAYKPNNALIITASPKDYVSLEKVIDTLDKPRKQVYVEAVIMEVTMDQDLKYGAGFNAMGGQDFDGIIPDSATQSGLIENTRGAFLGQSNFNPSNLSSLFTGGVAGSIGLLGPKATLPGTEISLPAFALTLQASQTDRSVNLMSAPSLLTLDNKEAQIKVQDKEPVPQSTGAGGGLGGLGSLLGGAGGTGTNQQGAGLGGLGSLAGLAGGGLLGNNLSYEEVGIQLNLTPQVNESNYIRLEIEQEVSDIKGGSTFSDDIPTTTERSAKTTVLVQDQSTVVIGGLMKERETKTVSKIPLFGDIPVFGQLFRSTGTNTVKQNLVLMLTPYIIESQSDVRKIYERKMKERKKLAEMFDITEKKYSKSINFQKKSGLIERMRSQISKSMTELKARREAAEAFEDSGPRYRILGEVEQTPDADKEESTDSKSDMKSPENKESNADESTNQ
jgi:general secretion pathway protein D